MYIDLRSSSCPATDLRKATCAAMTRWRSTTRTQAAQRHSLQRHSFLWPLRHEMTPWLRQRAHLGVRSIRRPAAAPAMDPVVDPVMETATNLPASNRHRPRRGQQLTSVILVIQSNHKRPRRDGQPSCWRTLHIFGIQKVSSEEYRWAEVNRSSN